jgi:hypothetical protein
MNAPDNNSSPSGSGGIVRLMVALCVLALAGLAALFVLDIVPRDKFQDLAVKALTLGGIGIVAALALGLLTRR